MICQLLPLPVYRHNMIAITLSEISENLTNSRLDIVAILLVYSHYIFKFSTFQQWTWRLSPEERSGSMRISMFSSSNNGISLSYLNIQNDTSPVHFCFVLCHSNFWKSLIGGLKITWLDWDGNWWHEKFATSARSHHFPYPPHAFWAAMTNLASAESTENCSGNFSKASARTSQPKKGGRRTSRRKKIGKKEKIRKKNKKERKKERTSRDKPW